MLYIPIFMVIFVIILIGYKNNNINNIKSLIQLRKVNYITSNFDIKEYNKNVFILKNKKYFINNNLIKNQLWLIISQLCVNFNHKNKTSWKSQLYSIVGFIFAIILFGIFVDWFCNYALELIQDKLDMVKESWIKEDEYLNKDILSLSFILLNGFIFPISNMSNWLNIPYIKEYFIIIMLILEWLLTGVFLVNDFISFYVTFESTLPLLFFLIGLYGASQKFRAGFYIFLYTILGSLFMLLSFSKIGGDLSSTSYQMESFDDINDILQIWLWIALFISFSVKTPLIPAHIWLPLAHSDANASGSIILASVVLKLALYGFIRILIGILYYCTKLIGPFVLSICLISIIYASVSTIRQFDFKVLVAYSSIAHMGSTILGAFSDILYGIIGSILFGLAHGFVSPALFILVGAVIYDRCGSRIINYYKGLTNIIPIFSLLFLFFLFGNMGVPLTANFVGEFLSLLAAYQANIFIVSLATLSVVFSAIYSIFLYNKMTSGIISTYIKTIPDLFRREFFTLLPLILLTLILGIYSYYLTSHLDLGLSTFLLFYISPITFSPFKLIVEDDDKKNKELNYNPYHGYVFPQWCYNKKTTAWLQPWERVYYVIDGDKKLYYRSPIFHEIDILKWDKKNHRDSLDWECTFHKINEFRAHNNIPLLEIKEKEAYLKGSSYDIAAIHKVDYIKENSFYDNSILEEVRNNLAKKHGGTFPFPSQMDIEDLKIYAIAKDLRPVNIEKINIIRQHNRVYEKYSGSFTLVKPKSYDAIQAWNNAVLDNHFTNRRLLRYSDKDFYVKKLQNHLDLIDKDRKYKWPTLFDGYDSSVKPSTSCSNIQDSLSNSNSDPKVSNIQASSSNSNNLDSKLPNIKTSSSNSNNLNPKVSNIQDSSSNLNSDPKVSNIQDSSSNSNSDSNLISRITNSNPYLRHRLSWWGKNKHYRRINDDDNVTKSIINNIDNKNNNIHPHYYDNESYFGSIFKEDSWLNWDSFNNDFWNTDYNLDLNNNHEDDYPIIININDNNLEENLLSITEPKPKSKSFVTDPDDDDYGGTPVPHNTPVSSPIIEPVRPISQQIPKPKPKDKDKDKDKDKEKDIENKNDKDLKLNIENNNENNLKLESHLIDSLNIENLFIKNNINYINIPYYNNNNYYDINNDINVIFKNNIIQLDKLNDHLIDNSRLDDNFMDNINQLFTISWEYNHYFLWTDLKVLIPIILYFLIVILPRVVMSVWEFYESIPYYSMICRLKIGYFIYCTKNFIQKIKKYFSS